MSKALFRAVLAALDTAAFRVDPWLTGIAERRLQAMIADGARFRLGAYGWVDAPAPFAGVPGGPLAPGPTSAGLLHAPSPAQALTAALLRDAAVRYPGSDRWNLTIDSAKVRASAALAERVRLGTPPVRGTRTRGREGRGRLGHRSNFAQDVSARRRPAGTASLRRPKSVARRARRHTRRRIARRSRRSTGATRRGTRHLLGSAGRRRRVCTCHRSRRSCQCGHGSGRGPRRAARPPRDSHAAPGDHRARECVGAPSGRRLSRRTPTPIPRAWRIRLMPPRSTPSWEREPSMRSTSPVARNATGSQLWSAAPRTNH